MPSYKIHLLVSTIITVISSIILIYFSKLELQQLIFLPYVLFLSIIPDIDTKKSKARKIINILFLFIVMILFILSYIFSEVIYILFIVIISFLFLIIYRLKHRSICHNPVFGLVMSFFLIFISSYLFLLGYISFLSHIVLDKLM